MINGVECYLVLDILLNKTFCLTAVELSTHEPYMEITKYIPDHWKTIWRDTPSESRYPEFPLLVIKDYSENEGIADVLVEQGVIKGHIRLAGCSGIFKLAVLTDKWEAELSTQLNKNN